MKRRVARSAIVLALISMASPLTAQDRCLNLESEVFSVDAKGAIHPLFNFSQLLRAGEAWSASLPGDLKNGSLSVEVAWGSSMGEPTPMIKLKMHVSQAGELPALDGSATIEQGLWEALFGPEPFKTSTGAALDLKNLGYPFAVVAVSSTKCPPQEHK